MTERRSCGRNSESSGKIADMLKKRKTSEPLLCVCACVKRLSKCMQLLSQLPRYPVWVETSHAYVVSKYAFFTIANQTHVAS
jgi:hypothetical protein